MIGMRVHLLICTFLALASYGAEPPPHDPAWAEDRQCFKSQTIYFGSSGSALSVEAKGKVAEVAKYVGAHPSTAVRIEGHSDDRGSAEHNLGIGDRRAEAVRKELIKAGIEPARIDTRTYGKDRPAVPGHSAEARARNRRAEFVLLKPPPSEDKTPEKPHSGANVRSSW